MADRTTEFGGKTWKRSGDAWVADFEPPRDLNLSIEPKIRIVGPRNFDDMDGEGSAAEVTEEQKAAASYFLEHQVAIFQEVLRQLLRYCEHLYSEDPIFFEELANVQTIAQVTPQVDQLQVAVEHDSADGFAWMSLTGGCDWEMEHGLGICLWKDAVLDIGTYDTVMAGPDPAYTGLPPLEDSGREESRRAVINSIASVREAEAEAAEQAALENMPDEVRLCEALVGRNTGLAEELIASGVRLDDFPDPYLPPVFMAIMAWDPDVLRRMIELGARTDVKNFEGQTPLEAANQMLQTFGLSQRLQKGVLGDLSSMMDGGDPAAGGVLSMLGDLQNEAAELLSQMDGEQHQPPAWDEERVKYHQDNIQNAANEVNELIPKLEEIVKILSSKE